MQCIAFNSTDQIFLLFVWKQQQQMVIIIYQWARYQTVKFTFILSWVISLLSKYASCHLTDKESNLHVVTWSANRMTTV